MNRAPCLRETAGGERCPSCVDRLNGRDPDGTCDDDTWTGLPAASPTPQPAPECDMMAHLEGEACPACHSTPQPALRCPGCEGDASDEWSGTEGIDWALCANCQPASQPYRCPTCDRPQPDDCVCWMYDGSDAMVLEIVRLRKALLKSKGANADITWPTASPTTPTEPAR